MPKISTDTRIKIGRAAALKRHKGEHSPETVAALRIATEARICDYINGVIQGVQPFTAEQVENVTTLLANGGEPR